VRLAGTTVSRASLHNEDEIRAKDIRVGDRVVVEKAGEIIPQVVEVIPAAEASRGEPFAMPDRCPVCGARAVRHEGEARRRCENRLACPGQLKASILHFARRAAMDIEHLGPSLVDQLVDLELVRDPADLYSLEVAEVEGLERMASKSAGNLVAGIAASRERTLDRLLGGLGIPLVGEVAARLLAERYGTLARFAKSDPEVEREALAEIHGIGPKIADSVADTLVDPRFAEVLDKLLAAGIDPRAPEPEGASGPLEGLSFCVTGVLSRPRGDIHEQIRRAGGEVHKAVKKGTDYLVAGDKVGKTKIEKAERSGARVIDEQALRRLLGSGAGDDGQ
jgi:DNA ligase (NAD+)